MVRQNTINYGGNQSGSKVSRSGILSGGNRYTDRQVAGKGFIRYYNDGRTESYDLRGNLIPGSRQAAAPTKEKNSIFRNITTGNFRGLSRNVDDFLTNRGGGVVKEKNSFINNLRSLAPGGQRANWGGVARNVRDVGYDTLGADNFMAALRNEVARKGTKEFAQQGGIGKYFGVDKDNLYQALIGLGEFAGTVTAAKGATSGYKTAKAAGESGFKGGLKGLFINPVKSNVAANQGTIRLGSRTVNPIQSLTNVVNKLPPKVGTALKLTGAGATGYFAPIGPLTRVLNRNLFAGDTRPKGSLTDSDVIPGNLNDARTYGMTPDMMERYLNRQNRVDVAAPPGSVYQPPPPLSEFQPGTPGTEPGGGGGYGEQYPYPIGGGGYGEQYPYPIDGGAVAVTYPDSLENRNRSLELGGWTSPISADGGTMFERPDFGSLLGAGNVLENMDPRLKYQLDEAMISAEEELNRARAERDADLRSGSYSDEEAIREALARASGRQVDIAGLLGELGFGGSPAVEGVALEQEQDIARRGVSNIRQRGTARRSQAAQAEAEDQREFRRLVRNLQLQGLGARASASLARLQPYLQGGIL